MQPIVIDIANGFYQSPSLPFSNQRCVNMYPNIPQAPAMTGSALFDTGGIDLALSFGYSSLDASRGGVLFDGKPYVVTGPYLYAIDRTKLPDGTYSYRQQRIGTVDGTGRCTFAGGKNQLLIINNEGTGYVYNANTRVLTPIADAGFYANGTPAYPLFINSYFVVVTLDNKAIISAVNDATDWNALDSIVAEADPDGLVASFDFSNQLYLLGEFTTEAFQNIVTAGVPFQRIEGYLIPVGCSARYSVIKVGPRVLWVGRGAKERAGVYAFDGSQATSISTIAIDDKLNKLSEEEIAGIFSWSYSTNGHVFVAFTTAKNTFVVDMQTGRWHERLSVIERGANTRVQVPCRIHTVITAFNELLVTDLYDGRIGLINEESTLEYDMPVPRFFSTAPLFNMAKAFTLPSVELLGESGVGNRLDPDPVVTMEVSRDGVVFEDPQSRELGRRGKHSTRMIWYKQGRVSKNCVLRFRCVSPVRCRWFGVVVGLRALQ